MENFFLNEQSKYGVVVENVRNRRKMRTMRTGEKGYLRR